MSYMQYASGPETNPPGWPSQNEADLAVQHGWSSPPGDHQPKKSRTGFWVLLGIVAGIVLFMTTLVLALAVGTVEQKPEQGFTSMPVQAPSAGEKQAKIGDKVTIEGLQYQVHGVKCGIQQVGPKDFGATAQGSFCRADLSVTNTGKDPATWDATYNVKAEDTKGREFGADSSAGIFGNKNQAGWIDQINPGNTVRAYVFFDLPAGAKLKELEVSSGLTGGEIEIKIP